MYTVLCVCIGMQKQCHEPISCLNNLTKYLQTTFLEQIPSWEVTCSSDGQQILRILRNPKVLHRVHKSPPLFYTMSQTNPVQISQFYILKVLFNIILPFTSGSSKRFLVIMFSNQILECILFFRMHVTCIANTSVLDLILLEIFGQECTSLMSWLGSFL